MIHASASTLPLTERAPFISQELSFMLLPPFDDTAPIKMQFLKSPLPTQLIAPAKRVFDAVSCAALATVTPPLIVPPEMFTFADFFTLSPPTILPFRSMPKSPVSTSTVPFTLASSFSVQPLFASVCAAARASAKVTYPLVLPSFTIAAARSQPHWEHLLYSS